MDIPKWSTHVLLAAGAVSLGWIAKDALGGVASSSAEPSAAPSPQDTDEELVEALSALVPSQHADASRPIELTIVLDDAGVPVVTPDGSRTPTAGGGIEGSGVVDGPASPAAGRVPGRALSPSVSGAGSAGLGTGDGVRASGSGVATTGPPFWRALLHAPAGRDATTAAPTDSAPPGPSGGGLSLHLSPETGTVAVGEHIVIAYDDSIVLVGDNGRLTGNTGDAGQGGIVALDAQESAFTTSRPAADGTTVPSGTAGTLTTGGPGSTPQAGSATVAANGTMTALGSGTDGASPGTVSPLVSPIVSFSDGRAVDIAGYEDHSLAVRGERNIVTYDDSNVFMDRDGQINANTGDLDSAGLNAVDTVRSTVTAGDHCDDGCDDESIIQAQAGVFDEGDVAIDANGNPVWGPDAGDEDGDADEGDDSLPDDDGEDDDAEDDESDDGDVSDPVEPAESRDEADSGTDPTQAPSGDSLVIGGDGYDDLGIRVDGSDNIATYDDSNVVLGGSGDVNAQIGDADTGGVATMGTVDSTVRGGNSR